MLVTLALPPCDVEDVVALHDPPVPHETCCAEQFAGLCTEQLEAEKLPDKLPELQVRVCEEQDEPKGTELLE
ncbi:MAG: hypothetical protein E7K47_05580 [Acidovorax sp.]|nr:hypothetical protein [Acidovorax sp.]